MLCSQLLLFVVLFIAVITDVKSGKIKNWLTLPALALGPIIHFFEGGFSQTALSFAGMGAMIVVAALLLSFRLMGGGDAKLLVAVGSLAGWSIVLPALLFTALAGGLMAIISLLAQRKFVAVISQALSAIWLRLGLKTKSPWVMVSRSKLPYSVAIATGTVLAMFWRP